MNKKILKRTQDNSMDYLTKFEKMPEGIQIEKQKTSVIGYPAFSVYKGRIKIQIYADEVFVEGRGSG